MSALRAARVGDYGKHGLLLEGRDGAGNVEQVLGLYRERYFDLNVQHFHEKLQAEHDIQLSYSWVKAALQGAGLVARGAQARGASPAARAATAVRYAAAHRR